MEWTAETYREYGLRPSVDPVPIPTGARDVASALAAAAATRPDAEALVGRHARYTFGEFDQAVNAAVGFLWALGLRPGDRVAASAGNHPEIVLAFFAAMRMGAIWVGINRRLAPAEKRYLLKDSGVRVLLAEDEGLAEITASPEDLGLSATVSLEPANPASAWRQGLATHAGAPRPDVRIDPWAPAAIAYTSGTTGFPKGAVHSQHNMMLVPAVQQAEIGSAELAARRVGTTTPLTILNLMILGPVAAARAACAHICVDRTDPVGLAEWIGRERITHTTCAPTTAYDMLTRPDIRPEDLKSLEQLGVGGAMVPEKLPALYFERFGCLPRVGYGLTEAPTGVAASDGAAPSRQGEIGRPSAHLEVEILDDSGEAVGAGVSGEICVRAASTGPFAGLYRPTLGYWRNAEATDRLLRGGWLHTGDVGFKDEDGVLNIQDRRTDVIFRGGSNIYPAEVERVLRMDLRVADCAVLGKPDERLGQVVVAFVEPRSDARSDETLAPELEALCRENLAKYKQPVDWYFIDELPRNAMGKIVKPLLKERLEGRSAAASTNGPPKSP
jgi:acyl-CoA synthetase (AMP-forming)/AMP-acid ligase II